MKKFVIKIEDSNQRLDVFVAKKLPQLSRSHIQKLCDTGEIKINSNAEPARKILKDGDMVTVDLKLVRKVPSIKLPIIYEDSNVIVINKPAGILTHSKGEFNPEPTVANFIKSKLKGLSGERAGIVHRLDRATSGVMICAKNKKAQSWLQKQFSSRKVKKTYYAIVEGNLSPAEALIDMPIERDPKNPKTFRVGRDGRAAQTTYKVIKVENNYSLVELKPTTGRTHQIRVHLSHLGHPIVGDALYKGKSDDRLYLHAQSLELTLPSKDRKIFKADLPQDFAKLIVKHEPIN